jgi:hypothetical protein
VTSPTTGVPQTDDRRLAWSATEYAILGRRVEVRCADPAVLNTLDLVYERLKTPPSSAGTAGPPDTGKVVMDVVVDPGGRHLIEVGGRTIRVPDGNRLVHYAHLVLANAAAAAVSGGEVLHSGAVADDDGAVMLVGGSGAGKTTLTLALTRLGWRFMSDDFAVLRDDGTVEPLPRRANVTAETIELLGLEPPAAATPLATFGGESKWMLDVEEMGLGEVGGTAPLAAVFVLDDGRQGRGATPGATDWWIELDHLPDGLEEDVGRLRSVAECTALRERVPPVLRVLLRERAGAIRDLDAALALHDATALSAWTVPPGTDVAAGGTDNGIAVDAAAVGPSHAGRVDARTGATRDRARAPSLSLVSDARGLVLLVPHSLSLTGRRFLHGTEAGDALTTLARLHAAVCAAGAPVYRLRVGPPDATAAVVAAAAREPRDPPPRVGAGGHAGAGAEEGG